MLFQFLLSHKSLFWGRLRYFFVRPTPRDEHQLGSLPRAPATTLQPRTSCYETRSKMAWRKEAGISRCRLSTHVTSLRRTPRTLDMTKRVFRRQTSSEWRGQRCQANRHCRLRRFLEMLLLCAASAVLLTSSGSSRRHIFTTFCPPGLLPWPVDICQVR